MNGEIRNADKLTNGDINQNKAVENATSPHDTLNLSDSTIQAFQNALHFQPLSQSRNTDGTPQDKFNEPNNRTTALDQRTNDNVVETNKNNNYEQIASQNNQIENRTIFQGISLKDFEKHHKLMKEANLEKRRLLSNAIEQR